MNLMEGLVEIMEAESGKTVKLEILGDEK